MNNKHNIPSTNSREGYETGYEDGPDWDAVQERAELLTIPTDEGDRALDVYSHLCKDGSDIRALAAALHQVLVPGYQTRETDFVMAVESPSGESRHELATPDERQEIFDTAADHIQGLVQEYDDQNSKEFLERAANLVSLAIVSAHPYADGNGRTARYAGELLRGGPASENLVIAGSNRPDSGFRINSYVIKRDTSWQEALQTAASRDIPLAEVEMYHDAISRHFTTPYN